MRLKLSLATAATILVAFGVGFLITNANAAVPVTKNVSVGCDTTHGDNLVYTLKGHAIEVIPNGCGGTFQPSLQQSVVARCDTNTDNLIYVYRNRIGPIDMDVVEGGCAPPI